MPRKATGKPLSLFPIRVDEDVKAVLLEMKNKNATINAGLRKALVNERPPIITATVESVDYFTPEIEKRIAAQVKPRKNRIREKGGKTR